MNFQQKCSHFKRQSALVFGTGIVILIGLYYWTGVSRVALFWAAFILTRRLGATVGDFLDKPHSDGGLALSWPLASLVIAAAIVVLLLCHSATSREASRRGDQLAEILIFTTDLPKLTLVASCGAMVSCAFL